ncbi:MAG: alpha-amylase family glycosyl hydrolase [Planctomycetota bacterium]
MPGQFATFLANHDQNRAISQLSGSADKAAVAASLLLTSPGVPFIYYGEEIGMPGKKPDEDLRRPMQWSAEAQAGFTTGSPWRTPDSNYTLTNVAAQSVDPASLFSHYRALLALRNQHAALRVGSLNLVRANNPGVFADLRLSAGEAVLVLVNLTQDPIADYALTLDQSALASGAYAAASLMGSGPFAGLTVADGGGFKDYKPAMSLPAYGTIVIQLQK